jgi:predicted dehydrogenase
MALDLTQDQKNTGAANFAQASADLTRQANPNDPTRRSFLKTAAATGAVLPVSAAVYFGYDQWKGMNPVRTAIIGTGDEGGVLIGEHNPEFTQIVATCDIRPYNQTRIFTGDGDGTKWDGKSPRKGLNHIYGEDKAKGIRRFETVADLLKAKDELKLEAVIIATPLVTHHGVAIECMNAGLHVLCEKLMARRIEYCKEMIAAAKKNGVILSIGHQRHYSMLYAHALEVVKSGVLGEVTHIRALWHRNNSWPYTPKAGDPPIVPGTEPYYRDGWCPPLYQMDADKITPDLLKGITFPGPDGQPQQCFDDLEHLVRWRLYDKPGGGLMAELGSHQLDAASIFLGKVRPLSVQGVGGKFFYRPGKNDRESDDSVFVTYEFPGETHPKAGNGGTDDKDIVVVTYSSINTNSFESYGECLMGSRGTLIVESEGDAYLFKENQPGKANSGGKGTNVTVTGKDGKAPVMEAASTWGGPANSAVVKTGNTSGWGSLSRGYREEMEHFAFCVRTQQKAKLPGAELYKKGADGKFVHAGMLPRCHGEIAMADAVLALTANLAMDNKTRIEFKPEWFDGDATGKGTNPEDGFPTK